MRPAAEMLRLSLLASVLAAAAVAVVAQPAGGGGERMKDFRAALEKRFADADVNHDGRLSHDEAKAKMPRIYEHFDEIDAAHAGSISLKDIETWLVKQRQARKATS